MCERQRDRAELFVNSLFYTITCMHLQEQVVKKKEYNICESDLEQKNVVKGRESVGWLTGKYIR